MKTAPLFHKIRECDKKIIVLQGGGDAAKTVSALQHLGVIACERQRKKITVTASDVPNLKGGALHSFEKYVVSDANISKYIHKYNKTDREFTFKTASIIEFKAWQGEEDIRGAERDYLFVNEVTAQDYMSFWQMQRKTRVQVICDYNPSNRFWIHEKVLPGENQERQFKDRVQLFITDHRHNPFLSKEDHEAYEMISDPDIFRVYARGMTGKIKGLVFGHFKHVAALGLPTVADRVFFCIDWGYTNDPTAICKVWVIGKKRYVKELAYTTGLPADTIRTLLIENGYTDNTMCYCDADPNMINQLRNMGMAAVVPAIKGPNSIVAGISKCREHEVMYDKEQSPNFHKEVMTYKWTISQDVITGKEVMTNVPIDVFNHLMDAFRMGNYTDAIRNRI